MKLDTLYKRNTNPKLYEEEQESQNCGSFALGVDGWYCPYIENDEDVCEDGELWRYAEGERCDWIESLVAEGVEREEIMEDIIERDFEFILMTCPWLEAIQLEDIRKTDRVIAYRLCLNIPDEREEFDMEECTDFHFRVMIDGKWWEKNGGGPVHEVEDVYWDRWEVDDWLVYDGPVKYARFREFDFF